MAIAILYREEIKEYDFGLGHPFRGDRFEIFPNFLKDKIPPNDHYRVIKADPVTDEDLLLICSRDYINFTRDFFRDAKNGIIGKPDFHFYHSMDNMPCSRPGNVEAGTRISLGQAKSGCDLIQKGTYQKAVSIGGGVHHAKPSFGEGFCLYNDVAFSARYLINNYNLERVLILDTDAHAGNGTCEYFYDDPRVLFIDIHQDPHTLYPGTGFVDQIGTGDGKGFTVNVPLPPSAGYDSYLHIFNEIVEPLVLEFKPQLIIRNGGSDPHPNDGLTNLGLPVRGFHMIGEKVRLLADEVCYGRELDLIASGYNKHILPYCWLALLSGLANWDIDIDSLAPDRQYTQKDLVFEKTKLLESGIKNILKSFWKCFQ